jgi:hypothetical protein
VRCESDSCTGLILTIVEIAEHEELKRIFREEGLEGLGLIRR